MEADQANEIHNRRKLSYEAQSYMLLRHVDVLLAVADTGSLSKPGGTQETIQRALGFSRPVILIDLVSGKCQVFIDTASYEGSRRRERNQNWTKALSTLLHGILLGAPGSAENDPSRNGAEKKRRTDNGNVSPDVLLKEFFEGGSHLEGAAAGPRHVLRGTRLWKWLNIKVLNGETEGSKANAAVAPFAVFRNRASALNGHYNDGYRGTFFLNYLLAVFAVFLAAGSLALLAVLPHTAALFLVLMPLVIGKFFIVRKIYRSTERANHELWNERSVEYLYLSERLRTMYYLPRLGIFHPPAAAPVQYASRAMRQNTVDWLFDAIVRHCAPQDVVDEKGHRLVNRREITVPGASTLSIALISIELDAVISYLKQDWLVEQAVYHHRVQYAMEKLFQGCKRWGSRLGLIVMVIVVMDLVVVSMELGFKTFSQQAPEWLSAVGALMILLTAVLPACVSALNGIRFQSECSRLSDRSLFVRRLLVGEAGTRAEMKSNAGGHHARLDRLAEDIRQARSGLDNRGGWIIDAMLQTEQIALDFVEEVSEWSVLYAKEVVDT